MRFRGFLISVIFVLALPAAQAQQPMVEFSADTVESGVQGSEQNGKLYVGNNRIRTEIDINGQTLIQIIDLNSQEALMINPEEKSYLRRQAGGETAPAKKADATNPCAGMQNINCEQTGKEQVYGRPATKWEFSSTAGGPEGAMTIWIDEQRGIPTRQVMPDGSSLEMRMLGPEKVGGRDTEKWEMTMTGPDGKSSSSYQWYDPAIEMNIREEGGNGYYRELTNIRIGEQPDSLFRVPEGYHEMSIPQGYGGQGNR